MARIPIIEQSTIAQGGGNLPHMSANDPMGDALSGLAGALGHANDAYQHQTQQNALAWTSKQIGKDQADWQQHMIDRQNTADPSGADFTPNLLKDYDEWAAKSVQSAPNGISKDIYAQHLNSLRQNLAGQAVAFQAQTGRNYRLDELSKGIDGAASAIQLHPDDNSFKSSTDTQSALIDNMALSPNEKLKLKEDLANKSYTGLWLGRIDQDPISALKQLKSEGDPLVDGTPFEIRNRMIAHAENEKAKIGQNMQSELNLSIQNAETQANLNLYPTDRPRAKSEFMVAWPKDPVIANEKYSQYLVARATAEKTSDFQHLSTEDLLGVVNDRKDLDPSDPNLNVKAKGKVIEAAAAATIIQNRQRDPIQYAMDRGEFGIKPLAKDGSDLILRTQERVAAKPLIDNHYGVNSGIYTEKETKGLLNMMDTADAQTKVKTLQSLYVAIGNDETYKDVIQSFRKDSPVTAVIGNIASLGGDIHAGDSVISKTKVATTMAIGEDLLNPSGGEKKTNGNRSFVMPTEDILRQSFTKYVGDAYADHPNDYNRDYQAYRAYIAGKIASQSGGSSREDATPDFNDEALAAATGGVISWGGGVFSNGSRVVLPYGMTETDFHNRVDALWQYYSEKEGFTKTQPKDVVPVAIGRDYYKFRQGTEYAQHKDGSDLILRIQ